MPACWGADVPASRPPSARVSVAAAADLIHCVPDLSRAFQRQYPDSLARIVTGSSGNFFAQIQRGAPFDVLLSADVTYPRVLATNGLADGSTLRTYAFGRLVLWTRRADLAIETGLTVLTNASVARIALANPDHAPYGRAAREALVRAGVWDRVQSRVVLGDNVAQAAQFTDSGNADAGLVALSLVRVPQLARRGRWWLVPTDLHRPIEQGLIVTRLGSTNVAARRFAEFMTSSAAGAVLTNAGFELPASPSAPP